MGTNYYLHRNVCVTCGRSDDVLHIGKSSGGWCFSLHVIPELEINDLPDWQREWQSGLIRDEYGTSLDQVEMLRVITERDWTRQDGWSGGWWSGYKSEAEFHDRNYSERGPNGLLRHKVGRYCRGHGAGTWDLIPGEFS